MACGMIFTPEGRDALQVLPHNGGCCGAGRERTREAVLIFLRDELIYDIGNMAFVEGDIMEEGVQDSRHQLQDITADGNVDRVTRVLDLTFSWITEVLYPYARKDLDYEWLSDKFQEKRYYALELRLPESFSDTTFVYMKNLIHELLVCRALYDWTLTTKPEAAPAWKLRGDDAASELRGVKARRGRRTRLRQSPF